ncbi:D-alanyl-D-alanine carboxypeptidase family protein [Sphingobium yanoikuyae]|uniref:D-alanyl-D-alanine carboxypeptidase family protein n=1 Tax=Sphingobium yanoikuyae TaxID=13690 RepID=UPI002431B85D|nr:D-alanyl-D-alanine carboxypeptidase family protein [Sphingobium yanoikuyae]
MDDDAPGLGVGFEIDFYDSFGQLRTLDDLIGTTAANVVREMQRIDAATQGAVNMSAASASMREFGHSTREAATAARELALIEKTGESLVRQLERQNSTFGKSRAEVQALKVEEAALAAEQRGLTELAGRLRTELTLLQMQQQGAADAAEQEAQSIKAAAQAHMMFETRVRAGAKAMRDEEVAEQGLIARTHALKAAIDPAWASQQKFNLDLAEARSLMAAGAITLDDYSKRVWQLQQGLKQSSDAMDVQNKSSGAAKAGMQQLNFQLNDMATMWAMGAPPMQIFSSQAGQLGQALALIAEGSAAAGKGAQSVGHASDDAGADIEGFGEKAIGVADKVQTTNSKLAAIAGFMTGPWGSATLIAIAVLAPVIANMVKFDNAIDDATEKLKEQAKEQEIARQAQERFKGSAEGVAAAIRDGTRATQDALDALRSSTIATNAKARENYALALSTRQATLAEIEMAKVRAENAKGSWIGANGPNGAQSVVANQYAVEVDRLSALLKEQEQLIKDAQHRINVTNIDMAAEQAAIMTDPVRKINAAFDEQVAALKRTATARAQAGQATDANIASLGREFAIIEQNRRAALKAEQDRTSALKQSNNEIGRTITLLEARAIAEKAGGRVTSDLRSTAKQQELYDKYIAYKNGTGPWAALAAKPGTSNHELGQALDVAKTDGMTLKKLVTAYRAAGVKITEALDEGSHFHIAWAAGKAVTEAAKEADRIGKWLEDQQLKAQGNIWALTQEVDKRNADWGKGQTSWGDKDIALQTDAAALRQAGIDNARDALAAYMDDLDTVSAQVDRVAANMRDAFGSVGGAIGGLVTVLDEYGRRQAQIDRERELGLLTAEKEAALRKRAAIDQVGFFGDMSASAKGFFKEGSDGYKAMEAAEKAFRAVEFALSVRSMAQDAIETASSIAKSGARTATKAVEAVVSAISSLPFPLNLAAGAATIAALAGIGVSVAGSFGGGGNTLPKANDGSGTVLGDASAKSDSIKRAIDSLKEVDVNMLSYSRQMAASLSSIEGQIGGFAKLVLRTDNVNASSGVAEGFKANAIGSVLSNIPIIGGLLGGLFGTKTKVLASGLFGGPQTLEDILGSGFDASYYSDIQKKKKFFGLTTSTKYSTQYGSADNELENQFTLILRSFNDAILAAAGPLGTSTDEITRRLNGFVLNIGKIDLQGLTGEEIEEKLSAVFGAAADDMARAAFPGMEKFQKVGEGLFETLVRVASTTETVTASLHMLGSSAATMSVDLKMALADQFDSVSSLSDAIESYFETYYAKTEQAAARQAQFADVFDSLGLSMPSTLAGFRALVEAQDLTTSAGQSTYATLLQLAPAFADLQSAMNGAKSAADILSEREDLQRQLLEAQGDTAAIRALELAALDESNRALQEQIWALQDAKEAADAAQQLKDAWTSVGDSIMDEVNRIRGITDGTGSGSFSTLMGQFNAAVAAAKGGDQDAASSLPGLSQSLLQAAELAATSRQELDRVKAQTAASLESVYGAIMAANGKGTTSGTGIATGAGAPTGMILSAAATAAQVSTAATSGSGDMVAEIKALRAEVAQLRTENNAGHAANASNTGKIAKRLDDVTADSGGNAITVTGVAA